MKINTNKKPFIIALISLLTVGILALVVYIYAFNGSIFGWQVKSENTSEVETVETPIEKPIDSPPTDEQVKDGQDIKKDSLDEEQASPPPPSNTVNVRITAMNQAVAGGPLRVRSIIDIITSSGTCTLTLTKTGSNTITEKTGVQALASNSTCTGFNIDFSRISSGSWSAKVEYRNGDRVGISETSTIEVK